MQYLPSPFYPFQSSKVLSKVAALKLEGLWNLAYPHHSLGYGGLQHCMPHHLLYGVLLFIDPDQVGCDTVLA